MPKHPSTKTLKGVISTHKKLTAAVNKLVTAQSKAKPSYAKINELTETALGHADAVREALDDHYVETVPEPVED
jgi:hypothetical protein